eukprot:SAG31_NODE_16938_length_689_cov_2.623729_1_plen_37_part_10
MPVPAFTNGESYLPRCSDGGSSTCKLQLSAPIGHKND